MKGYEYVTKVTTLAGEGVINLMNDDEEEADLTIERLELELKNLLEQASKLAGTIKAKQDYIREYNEHKELLRRGLPFDNIGLDIEL